MFGACGKRHIVVESLEEKENHIIAKKWKRQEDGRTREMAQWLEHWLLMRRI